MLCKVPQGIERVKLLGKNEELVLFSWKNLAHMYRETLLASALKSFTTSYFPRSHFCAIYPFFPLTSKSNKRHTFTEKEKDSFMALKDC